jgi:hypothetical protein
MSRFELGGLGSPIPIFALPDPNLSEDLPPQTLILEDGVPFIKLDWVNLGYTHYEVWCIGACGGKGGDAASGVSWPYHIVQPHPTDQPVTHWYDPYGESIQASGGAGGGGGLHKSSGLLADLPASVPVVVGVRGADAPVGYAGTLDDNSQGYVFGAPYTPNPPPPWPSASAVYDLPHKTFYAPVDGGDGGASTFGGTICRASGGKGGKKAVLSNLYYGSTVYRIIYPGAGGDGGAGDRSSAGGGAVGGWSETVWAGDGSHISVNIRGEIVHPPSDGTWDGVIGQGGGGGPGGRVERGRDLHNVSYVRYYGTGSGSKGAFSFGDTTVYGPQQNKGAFVYVPDTSYSHTPGGEPVIWDTYPILAGGGGGAHRNESKFGSLATGYSPNGFVLIRIYKTA